MREATRMLIETIEQVMGYDHKEAFEYAIKLTKMCHEMLKEDEKKENK